MHVFYDDKGLERNGSLSDYSLRGIVEAGRRGYSVTVECRTLRSDGKTISIVSAVYPFERINEVTLHQVAGVVRSVASSKSSLEERLREFLKAFSKRNVLKKAQENQPIITPQ